MCVCVWVGARACGWMGFQFEQQNILTAEKVKPHAHTPIKECVCTCVSLSSI